MCFIIKTKVINSASAINIITDCCLRFTQKIGPSANLKIKSEMDRLSSLLKIKSELK